MSVLLVLLLASAPRMVRAAAWKAWSPADHAFSISFPASPQIQTNTQGPRPIHLVSSQDLKESFAVMYMDMAADPVTAMQARQILDAGCDAFLRGAQGKLLKKHDLTLGSSPGRELEVQDGETTTLVRFYTVGKRIYQLSAVRPNGAAPAHAQQFMQSFHLGGKS